MNRVTRQACPASRRAFTLVEVLVVITIVSILVAMLIPAVSIARENARRVACGVTLRMFTAAMLIYEQDYQGLPLSRWNVPNYVNDPSRTELRNRYNVAIKSTLCPSAGEFPNTVGWWNQPATPNVGRLTYFYFGGWGGRPAATSNIDINGLDIGWNPTAFKSISQGYGPIFSTLKPGIAKAVSLDKQYLMGDLTTFGPTTGTGFVPDLPNHGRFNDMTMPEGTNVAFADGHVEWHTLRSGIAWGFWVVAGSGGYPSTYWSPRFAPPTTISYMP